jgi:hypothetical protein
VGHSSVQRKIVKTIPKWGCLGYWGHGHGRSVKEHGEKWFKELSVCQDLCPQSDTCRRKHHDRMDQRFPAIADIVHKAAGHANKMKMPIVQSVIGAMNVAYAQKTEGVEEIKAILIGFRVEDMTDHYVCGQFENIQNGLDGKEPAFSRPIPERIQEPAREASGDRV